MKQLQSRLLANFSGILHTFTTRHGGQSKASYACNNIAFHVGDNEEDVRQNHLQWAEYMGYDLNRLVHMRQIHSDHVRVVDDSYGFHNPPECDALITATPNLPLMVMVADCTPILLYDPGQQVIAVIHAGRAGAFKNIVAATIEKMQEHFDSRPDDLIVALGPAICANCYEVNETIYEEARSKGLDDTMYLEEGKWHLDVGRILYAQLLSAGVLPEKIEKLEVCSSCENDRFFSYRADGGTTGRMAGIIMLTPSPF